jgi:hypothetical protein
MSESSQHTHLEDAPEEPLPQCRCGTDAQSKYAVIDREYSFFGTLYLLWGGTSVPSRVSFRCVKCGDMFESTTSPSVCREYIK